MFDKILDLFRSGPSVPDFIVGVGLEEWYTDLSEEQQQKLHEYSTFFGTGGEMNLLDKGTVETSQSAQEYLKSVGSTAASQKDYCSFNLELLIRTIDSLKRESSKAAVLLSLYSFDRRTVGSIKMRFDSN